MVYQSRTRKRVQAIRRGPDGSAFEKCGHCGVLVAIALVDMHECEVEKNEKKLINQCGKGKKFQDQPRSAYHFFMEEFMKTCGEGNEVDVDRKAVEIWRSMSASERQPYVVQAEKLNSAYVKALVKEENDMTWVDDEADSAEVGKFDENYEDCDPYDNSEDCSGLWSETSESFDIFEWASMNPWMFEKSP